jgi:signal transduction histidine kinase
MKHGIFAGLSSRIAYRHKVAVLIYVFVLLPFLVVSLLVVRKAWNDRVHDILEQNRSALRLGVEAVDTMLYAGLQKLFFINTNSLVTSYLDKGGFDDLAYDFTVYTSIERTIDALLAGNPKMGFVIYPTDERAYNGEYVEKLERLRSRLGTDDARLMEELLSLNWEKQLWRYQGEQRAGDSFNTLGYLCCYKKMQLLNKTLAITELHIDASSILAYIRGEFPVGSRIVYRPDESGNRIVGESRSPSEEPAWTAVSGAVEPGGAGFFAIAMELQYSTGAFTLLIPRDHIRSKLPVFLLVSILVVFVSGALLFSIVELASFLITRRLSRLIDSVNAADEAPSESPIPGVRRDGDDIGRLEDRFESMLRKIREGYERVLEHENERKTHELELLQSRINPHFLYNTLSTLKWNCKDGKMAAVIDSMVLYYRLALNRGDAVVKVSEEMKLVEEYLKIQRYTYESDFGFTFDVDERVMESLTIRHLLQPIVENALMHGIKGRDSGGMIELSGRLREGTITFTVKDNGVGMPEETLQQLLSGEYRSSMGGYGIRNVKRRISLFYGPRSAFTLESEPGRGTTAVITVPARWTPGFESSKG